MDILVIFFTDGYELVDVIGTDYEAYCKRVRALAAKKWPNRNIVKMEVWDINECPYC